ncbi:MAG: hypothetical protein ACYTFG_10765, partial [Planctomycetota bacterium]
MQPIERILEAAFDSLKSLRPGAKLPAAWSSKASELDDGSPAQLAAFISGILRDLAQVRRQVLEGVAESDTGLAEILDVIASLPAPHESSLPVEPGLVVTPSPVP